MKHHSFCLCLFLALLVAVSASVDKIVAHFSTAKNLVQKVRSKPEAAAGTFLLPGEAHSFSLPPPHFLV